MCYCGIVGAVVFSIISKQGKEVQGKSFCYEGFDIEGVVFIVDVINLDLDI